MTELEWWGVAEAASHCGVQPGTWRDYVARGLAPQPDDPDTGAPPNRRRPRWRIETVKTWHAGRPGKGGRPRKTAPRPDCAQVAHEVPGCAQKDPTTTVSRSGV